MSLLRGNRPNVIRGGNAIPINSNTYFMRGRKHEAGGIDIGANPRTGIEVEDGEVIKTGRDGMRVYSAQPILNGVSPANLILGGADPLQVFNAQEAYKKHNGINNDGTKFWGGGFTPYNTPGKPMTPVEMWDGITKKAKTDVGAMLLRTGVQIIDPTGITSWGDAKDAWDNWRAGKQSFGSAALDMAGAIPLVGKVGKVPKLIKAGRTLVKGADIISDASKVSKAVQAANNASKASKAVRTVNAIEDASKVAKTATPLVQRGTYVAPDVARVVTPDLLWDSTAAATQASRAGRGITFSNRTKGVLRTAGKGLGIGAGNTLLNMLGGSFGVGSNLALANLGIRGARVLTGSRFPNATDKLTKLLKYTDNKYTNIGAWGIDGAVAGNRYINYLYNEPDEDLGLDDLAYRYGGIIRPSFKNGGESKTTKVKTTKAKTTKKETPPAYVSAKSIHDERYKTDERYKVDYDKTVGALKLDRNRYASHFIKPNINAKNVTQDLKNTIKREEEKAKQRQAIASRNKLYGDLGRYTLEDAIAAGSNIIGSIASHRINKDMIDSLSYRGRPNSLLAAKLNTEVNINPMLDKLNESLASQRQAIDNNTMSGRTALQRIQRASNTATSQANQLYANKQNTETELINKDALNAQSVAHQNVLANNNWEAGRIDFENKRKEMYAENTQGLVQGIDSTVQDTIYRGEKRINDLYNMELAMLANPNAYRLVGMGSSNPYLRRTAMRVSKAQGVA